MLGRVYLETSHAASMKESLTDVGVYVVAGDSLCARCFLLQWTKQDLWHPFSGEPFRAQTDFWAILEVWVFGIASLGSAADVINIMSIVKSEVCQDEMDQDEFGGMMG